MVSIIVPYHNREHFLPQTLKSIAASDYRPITLILVDNNSTDNSRHVCESFAADNRAEDFEIILTEETEAGAANARNKGLKICKTPFVYFFDSDDEFQPHFISTIMPMLNENIDLLAVTTNVSINGGVPVKRKFIQTESPVAQILTGQLSTQAMVLRTDFLRDIGGWNNGLPMWNDWELGVRVICANPRMKWLLSPSFHTILIHDDSLTGSSFSDRILSMRKAVEAVENEIPESCHKALYFRMEFITGNLMKEKNLAEAEENKKLTRQWFNGESGLTKFFGACIRRYVSLGGRGSWRFAYWLSK